MFACSFSCFGLIDLLVGGQDFDNRLVEYFVKEFESQHQVDVSKNPKALRKLKEKAQEAKHILSLNSKVLRAPFIVLLNIPLDYS